MRTLLFFSLIQLFCCCGVSEMKTIHTQSDTSHTNNTCQSQYDSIVKKDVYVFVDEMPIYPGGESALLKFFATNYKQPEQEYFQGTFLLEFVIDNDGQLISPRIKNKTSAELTKAEKEALRVLETMPKWAPGKCNGVSIPVLMFLPIKF